MGKSGYAFIYIYDSENTSAEVYCSADEIEDLIKSTLKTIRRNKYEANQIQRKTSG